MEEKSKTCNWPRHLFSLSTFRLGIMDDWPCISSSWIESQITLGLGDCFDFSHSVLNCALFWSLRNASMIVQQCGWFLSKAFQQPYIPTTNWTKNYFDSHKKKWRENKQRLNCFEVFHFIVWISSFKIWSALNSKFPHWLLFW